MDCQDCAQAQARQEDGRGQSGSLAEQCRRREERQNGQVVQVSAAPAPRLSRSERLASTVVANGAPAPGMLPKRPDRRARPTGQGRQVERGDRCDEQHIGDDQRAFLAGAQASQRAGGKIAHGESDAECGGAQSDLGHVQGIAQAQDFSRQQKGGDTRPVPQSLASRGARCPACAAIAAGAARPEPSPPLGRDRRAWPCGRREAARQPAETSKKGARQPIQPVRTPAMAGPVAMPAVMPSMTTPIAAA